MPNRTVASTRLGTVMLTWNQREVTLEGLACLARLSPPKPRVVLVDNGSHDGTAESVRKFFPWVDILQMPENLGFCTANNRGAEVLLKDTSLDYIIFLNNDIDMKPDCLNRLVDFMDSKPRAGACGPLIFYYEPSDSIWAAGGRIFPDLMWFPPILRGKPDSGLRKPREVGYIHGCALMVRRRTIAELGMFDERFFIYHDEVDWCYRMHKKGWQVWLVPEAHLYHKVTQAVGAHSPMMIYYTARNKLLFWWKHGRLSDLPKFYAFHLWKAIRIFAKAGSWWSIISLGKALIDGMFGLFGKGHIEQARKL